MYTTTSKQQQGCTLKDSHPKCFIMTNSTAMLSPGAVNRGDVHLKVSFNSRILVEDFVVGTCNSCMFFVFHEFEMKYSAGV